MGDYQSNMNNNFQNDIKELYEIVRQLAEKVDQMEDFINNSPGGFEYEEVKNDFDAIRKKIHEF